MKLLDQRGRLLGRLHLLDGVFLLVGLAWLPLIPYAYRIVSQRTELNLFRVDPAEVYPGKTKTISLSGSGFDPETLVQLGSCPPQKGIYINSARLDVPLPETLSKGSQPLTIRNGRGRLMRKEQAFTVVWEPFIEQVRFLPTLGGASLLMIYGNAFEPGCSLALDGTLLADTTHQSHRVLEVLASMEMTAGAHRIEITNPSGMKTSWEGIIPAGDSHLLKVLEAKFSQRQKEPLTITGLRPERIESDTQELMILGSGFDRDCRVFLGEIPLTQVQVLSPAVLVVQLADVLPDRLAESLPVVVIGKDGTRAVQGAKLNITPVRTFWAQIVLVVRFQEMSRIDLESLDPNHPEAAAADSNAAKTISILDQTPPRAGKNNGSALVELVLPVDVTVSPEQQSIIYRGQAIEEGRPIEIRIPGRTCRAVVVSKPLILITKG